jgi:predicted Zn finger-like uncharacterized protein
MKISCQSCGAKYNIADEKVRGKIVKIACKKCGARIEIDGREPQEQATDQDETRVYDQPGAPGGGGAPGADVWTVSVDDNDQREVSTAQLLDLYAQGTINAETFVWREGMADWQMVRDVDGLRDRLPAQMPSAPPQQQQSYSQPPAAAYAPSNGGMAAAAAPQAQAYPAPAIDTAQPARLGGSRRGGAADLFAAPHGAAEDEDIATSAPTAGAALAASMGGGGDAAIDQRPIGARNENSVLFSLAALTASGPATPAATVTEDEKSGLIDIQKLAAAAKPGQGQGDRAKLDDIMNLGGGGAFGSALGAPILAPPPTAALEAPPEEKKKSNALLFVVLGLGAVIVALLVVLLTRGGSKEGDSTASKDKDKGLSTPSSSTATGGTAPTDTGTANAAPTDTAPPDTTASGPIGTKGTGGKTPIAGTAKPGTTDTATKPTASATDTGPAVGAKPGCKTLEECMGAGKTPPPAPTNTGGTSSGGPDFDKGAAVASLKSIPYKDCGSGGAGSVTVTFAPSGSAVSAAVSGDYDGGTKSCISGRFKGARVPAFGGPAKTVGWKISL